MSSRIGRILAGIVVLCLPAFSQQRAFTAADYERAEKFMGYNTNPLVLRSGVRPTWLADERFWYRITTENGSEFMLVDPAKGTKEPAFDQAKLAAALSRSAGNSYKTYDLPFQTFEMSNDGKTITLSAANRQWTCDRAGMQCEADTANAGRGGRGAGGGQRGGGQRGGRGAGGGDAANGTPPSVNSPDGKWAAFIRSNNLWVRDTATNQEKQLTTDGIQDFGYATDNAGWTKSDRPVVVWSPDSKKIATFQHDARGTGDMYLVTTKVGHPELQSWKYPLPGDDKIFRIERVIIDVETAKVVRMKMPPDPHRSSLCDHVVCGGVWADVQWSPDSTHLAFVSTSRDHKQENLRITDAAAGDVRDVLEEKVPTYYESGNGAVNWRYLPNSNEAIWFSERDNWGQLYLYDLNGKLKNPITSGEGNITRVLRVDEKNRLIYFLGVGKEKGRDPYFVHLYKIGFDGRNLKLLTPENATHDVTLSPSGKYFTDSYSKPDAPPVAVLRDTDGKLMANLETADISKLTATGWKPPMPITVKARDGITDLYGLMYTPPKLDTTKKYPIINHVYPGPQTGSVGSRNFSAGRGDDQALAELGFVVVEIDGMGTPWRSKKFHDAYFANLGDNTLPDQVAGMKDLARRFSYIDIDRAGIWGHSGGGYATADAMFRFPDFFKVGISEAGNHDNREYEDDWGEKWQGLLTKEGGSGDSYDNQANQNFAKNLKGKLLLAHGTTDSNVPPYNTLLVVNELIKANKDFDLILLPNRNHGFGNEPYMIRRRWDYFVKNLLGAEPPSQYEMRQNQ
jgi:dipeptidyl aminopeptidase/acylaminoacyl peptidase